MAKLSEILRLVALSLLFGGSATVVFVAITLVKAAEANGIPTSEAAANNAPAFIGFAMIAACAAIVLLVSEAIDLFVVRGGLKNASKMVLGRYGASLLCAIATFVFAFVIVPPMKELQPQMKADETKVQEFRRWHETSRGVFGVTILGALAALVLHGLEYRTPPRP